MVKINRVENNEVKELLKKFDKEEKTSSLDLIVRIMVIIVLSTLAFFTLTFIVGVISIWGLTLLIGFIIVTNFILNILLGIFR